MKQIDEKTSAESHVESIVKSVSECVDKFAPLRISSGKEPSNQWIINKIKNAITKRNKLFQIWVEKSTKSNHDDYKSFRNKVCSMIREAKKQDNFRKLSVNPTARAVYWTLKTLQGRNFDKPMGPFPVHIGFYHFISCILFFFRNDPNRINFSFFSFF